MASLRTEVEQALLAEVQVGAVAGGCRFEGTAGSIELQPYGILLAMTEILETDRCSLEGEIVSMKTAGSWDEQNRGDH